MPAFIDLTGQRFGRWTVCGMTGKRNGKIMWLCRCDCGNTKVVIGGNLRRSKSYSCGCLQKKVTKERSKTHGESKTRLYTTWFNMRNRCRNPKNKNYKDYGQRGITVCAEWEYSYASFRDWAYANGYSDDLTLDRIDNDMGYSPDNCRWETRKTQANNRRCVRLVTFNGESHSVREWSDLTGIDYATLRSRLGNGWSIERALTKKPKTTV